MPMLHPIVDASTWLDLAGHRDGERWIVSIRLLAMWERLKLLIREIVVYAYRAEPRTHQDINDNPHREPDPEDQEGSGSGTAMPMYNTPSTTLTPDAPAR
jgi:hypothetical protein